jgi:apolipoprotein N-acyltransferase
LNAHSDALPLSPGRRLLRLLGAWLAIVLGGPGILVPDGVWLLVIVGLAVWSASASRPGKGAFWIEWFVASLAWAWICGWVVHVWPGAAVIMGIGLAFYAAVTGWLLRRLVTVAPLALAVPLAWIGVETLKSTLPSPFGFPWMRLGVHLHAADWILGSARVWGVIGLGWVLATIGGCAGDALRALGGEKVRLGRSALLAGVPLVLGVLFPFVAPAPETIDGPRVLLVQPNISQSRKMKARTGNELFREGVAFTRDGLERARERAEPEFDLVCWGETMLGLAIVDRGLLAALEAGARTDPWAGYDVDAKWVEGWLDVEDNIIGQGLFGKVRGPSVLPAGASFVAGAEYHTARDGRVRRQNSVFLWNANGDRVGVSSKLHLVPSAETLVGLERFGFARAVILKLAGYVPDFLAADEISVLEFEARDGRRFRFGGSVCFDNAFDDAYTGPCRRGPVDFHLVVSNEAWYLQSHEVDQMMAFSHVAAASTARALVRATNSGASAVIGPDGREVARLVVDGNDREVGGTLAATVPVPEADAGVTFYVRSERLWQLAVLAAPLAALVGARRRRRAAG